VVDADDVEVRSGSVRVIAPPGPDAPVELRVMISGRVASGSLSARPARQWRLWRALWRRLFGGRSGDGR
jgi:hypothetical protein